MQWNPTELKINCFTWNNWKPGEKKNFASAFCSKIEFWLTNFELTERWIMRLCLSPTSYWGIPTWWYPGFHLSPGLAHFQLGWFGKHWNMRGNGICDVRWTSSESDRCWHLLSLKAVKLIKMLRNFKRRRLKRITYNVWEKLTSFQGHRPVSLSCSVKFTSRIPGLRKKKAAVCLLVYKTSETRLLIRCADVAAVHLCHKVVGAPLLPVSNAMCLLCLALGALDVNAGLIAEHKSTLIGALVKRWKWVRAKAMATTVRKGICSVYRAIHTASIHSE